jgi:DNA polymerase
MAASRPAIRLQPAFVQPHAEAKRLSVMRENAQSCERCDLYKNATQTVFGEGLARARIVLVGEQPGDQEDLSGRPFVGPAGRVLDECLHEAGIDRSSCYVPNAVKHFKFEPLGKRRIHAKPNAGEIQKCAWWLGAELEALQPDIIVALGASALYSLMGRSVRLTQERGKRLETATGTTLLVTIHPSYLHRLSDHAERAAERARFVQDLASIEKYVSRGER